MNREKKRKNGKNCREAAYCFSGEESQCREAACCFSGWSGSKRPLYEYKIEGFMALFKNKYRVESVHLQNYDYSSEGYYYVTICLNDRNTNTFGNIKEQKMVLSDIGVIVEEEWKRLPITYPNIELGEYIFMPEHMHGVIKIVKKTEKSLHLILRAYKSKSAIAINKARGTPGEKVWQSGYYDRVIRNEKEYLSISEYIKNNPIAYEQGKEEEEWKEL